MRPNRAMQDDGWFMVATRGNHRQFKHSANPGRVTVPGKRCRVNLPTTWHLARPVFLSSLDRRNEGPMRYAIVIEKAEGNFSAYVPDLPGCVATGGTNEEVESQIREAIEFHLEGMREDGTPIPPPASRVDYVDIAA